MAIGQELSYNTNSTGSITLKRQDGSTVSFLNSYYTTSSVGGVGVYNIYSSGSDILNGSFPISTTNFLVYTFPPIASASAGVLLRLNLSLNSLGSSNNYYVDLGTNMRYPFVSGNSRYLTTVDTSSAYYITASAGDNTIGVLTVFSGSTSIYTNPSFTGSIYYALYPTSSNYYTVSGSVSAVTPLYYTVNFSSSYDPHTASGSIFNISLANSPYTDLIAVSQSNSAGTASLQVGVPYNVRMINTLANNITGSFSTYNTRTTSYITSQSNASDNYFYYTTITPQVGDNYIVSASFIATGSV